MIQSPPFYIFENKKKNPIKTNDPMKPIQRINVDLFFLCLVKKNRAVLVGQTWAIIFCDQEVCKVGLTTKATHAWWKQWVAVVSHGGKSLPLHSAAGSHLRSVASQLFHGACEGCQVTWDTMFLFILYTRKSHLTKMICVCLHTETAQTQPPQSNYVTTTSEPI